MPKLPVHLDDFSNDEARPRWMSVLAHADPDRLRELVAAAPALPPHTRLRGPEVGLLLVRGRQGGDGAAFNLGEVTVVRCTVRQRDGTVGHAYALGRDLPKAELSARLDAALQTDARPLLLKQVILPLAELQLRARHATAARAQTTRVEFQAMGGMR